MRQCQIGIKHKFNSKMSLRCLMVTEESARWLLMQGLKVLLVFINCFVDWGFGSFYVIIGQHLEKGVRVWTEGIWMV